MSHLRDIFCQHFQVDNKDYDKAKQYQNEYSGRIERILINMGAFAEDRLADFYAHYLQLPLLENIETIRLFYDAEQTEKNCAVAQQQWLQQHQWCAVVNAEQQWLLISADPLNTEINQWLEELDANYTILIASQQQLQELINELHPASDELIVHSDLSHQEVEKLKELASEAPVVSLLNGLMTRALRENASDMHIEPVGDHCQIRFRVDGVLHSEENLPKSMQLPVVTRIKILSGMDIAEKRRPQDGKIAIKIAQQELDIRVSALPLHEGESVVMRFLRKDALSYNMRDLGIAPDLQQKIDRDLTSTAGVILLTGPTGSGKTTSLYTFLSSIHSEQIKIITLEDPVEYQLLGVNQVQVKPDIGFDFAAGLRSIVRQDPDVIMLGEIRDAETARIALQSAITGHLVFSTVHTNDAASAYTRLLDLGIDEFLLNAALISIIAQRLVRTLCEECKQPLTSQEQQQLVQDHPHLPKLAERLSLPLTVHKPGGCDTCAQTGFRGRKAILEYLPCDTHIKSLPKNEQFILAAQAYNESIGHRTMLEDGYLKVITGITTLAEVLRVAG